MCYFKKQNNKTLKKFQQNLIQFLQRCKANYFYDKMNLKKFFINLMSLFNLRFIFDIVKKTLLVWVKTKFNFFKFLTMIKIRISQHFSIKTLSNISKVKEWIIFTTLVANWWTVMILLIRIKEKKNNINIFYYIELISIFLFFKIFLEKSFTSWCFHCKTFLKRTIPFYLFHLF